MPIIFRGVNEGESPMDLVASHQRLLVGAALRTKGPMLELGCGYYSTPILHEIAVVQKRRLLTLDNHDDWLQNFQARDWKKYKAEGGGKYGLGCDYHTLSLVGYWGEIDRLVYDFIGTGDRFGLVFVDQAPEAMRELTIRYLVNAEIADVFVMHDTECGFPYGYSRTLPMFRYKWTDMSQQAETTVASNEVDVTKWFPLELPRIIARDRDKPKPGDCPT